MSIKRVKKSDIFKEINPLNNKTKYANRFVIGTAGSGKHFFYINKLLETMDSNFVLVETNDHIVQNSAEFFERTGHEVMVYDPKQNYRRSPRNDFPTVKYNPFAFMETNDDVYLAAHVFINTFLQNSERDKSLEKPLFSFWSAVFSYVSQLEPDKRNFHSIVYGSDALFDKDLFEDDRNFEKIIRSLNDTFERVKYKNPTAYENFHNFMRFSSTVTLKTTIRHLLMTLDQFYYYFSDENEIDLDALKQKKAVLYIITNNDLDDGSSSALKQIYPALLISQLYKKLEEEDFIQMDDEKESRRHVHFIFSEFNEDMFSASFAMSKC